MSRTVLANGAWLVLLLSLLTSGVTGQGIPSSAECQSRINSIGQTGLLSQLSSCRGGATAQCCTAAQGLLGFPGSGQLAGCLCNADVEEGVLAGVEQNQLARSSGVTRASTQTVLSSCNVPRASAGGSCPAGGAPASPGTQVSVSAPGTQVGVNAPGAPATPAAAATATAAAPAPAAVPAPTYAGKKGGFFSKKHPILSKLIGRRLSMV
eukprot:GHRR01000395.1.p1 GENE.GHRR01000395.1~~GHRR01000395.1.p1  ORF type:complete len:209 (+),score=54.24 GHRR01000395.1:183-809(+)